ncbi:hypothetical protein PPACK8108_LOCUS6953 [Phakopsora pachyrhizi]|uniref:Mannose-P-dolichol utilization defect 1 protein homolog n=1 Tax=Phakopsora pachyrhizi TaxID=170000 RepID=A0AAV0AT98_PHAPC|nr:hypothetical protein PPACK8108_LOCUS6330 [Phakopsora pachyrhizi]CAH7672156.1 hypothetical protein PPACK8108_LOCUS6953 [Phakopsora pachyrhizi]
MSWLYPITHNIPWIIRTPAVAILGPECYTDLVYNVQLDQIHCLKYGISKALSLIIVFGSSIVKVPQIIKIIRSRSARGLSLISFLLDTSALIIIVGYNYRHEFPITTYGESFLLFVQNIAVISLIIIYSKHSHSILLMIISVVIPILSLTMILIRSSPVPLSILKLLLSLSIPLSLFSKIPQILINFKQGSTGQLSSFLVFSSFFGCLARLFTTLTETGDQTLLINFGLGCLLNGILSIQMVLYWKSKDSRLERSRQSSGSSSQPLLSSQPSTSTSTCEQIRLNRLERRSSRKNMMKDKNFTNDDDDRRKKNSPSINLNAPKQWTRKAI